MIYNVKTLGVVFITFAIFICSCNTVRMNQGFSYKPAVEGPSIGSQPIEEAQSNSNAVENVAVKESSFENNHDLIENQLNQQTFDLIKGQEANQVNLIETQKPIEIKKTLQQVVNQYAVENNKPLTQKQQKKLNKIAKIIEHKATFSSINWEPETNIELFFLMGAGLGLLVGLLSIGLGWFVFTVFGLLYLYYKLVL